VGAKAIFDSVTRVIQLTEAPDANGDVNIDVQVDLYSDGKEDWVASEGLRRVVFPIATTGGNPLPGAKSLGSVYFLRPDWKIQPYDADHRLIVSGDFYATDGSDPFLSVPGRTVRIVQEVSALTTVVEGDGASAGDWQDAEKAQMRDALGIDGTKTTAVGGQLQGLPDAIADAVLNELVGDHQTPGSLGWTVQLLADIEGGRWHIVNNQMVFYKADNITEVARFDLVDAGGSPTMTDVMERKVAP